VQHRTGGLRTHAGAVLSSVKFVNQPVQASSRSCTAFSIIRLVWFRLGHRCPHRHRSRLASQPFRTALRLWCLLLIRANRSSGLRFLPTFHPHISRRSHERRVICHKGRTLRGMGFEIASVGDLCLRAAHTGREIDPLALLTTGCVLPAGLHSLPVAGRAGAERHERTDTTPEPPGMQARFSAWKQCGDKRKGHLPSPEDGP